MAVTSAHIMSIVGIFGVILYYALLVFVIAMWARLILDFLRAMRPGWRPPSFLLVISGVVYGITDPPMKAVRRFVKPVSFGAIALDFGWTVVMLGAIVAMYIAEYLMVL
ncbi:YggT family protein [uncultured Aurantimicrobium sp.]|uniref:YggT family protein n=1 Tax=uncultured Aurantimicrobium sp. TaxID=1705357 RepID=UPI002627277F|nr:YggT family protein [uncultured Aurantimicrobium sp.]